LDWVYKEEEFSKLREFFRALADALGTLTEEELENSTRADVTWDRGAAGALIDFGEWKQNNLSVPGANAVTVETAKEFSLSRASFTAGATLHLYVSYLKRASNG
jgi:hypothetical protein